MKELVVIGVRVEYPVNQPILLLKEKSGERYLPIWVAAPEATAIAYELNGVRPPRPLTHDLFCNLLSELSLDLERVVLTGIESGVYYSTLSFSSGLELDARPSDAVALALRAGCPIFATDALVDEIAMPVGGSANEDDEVERFRKFLEDVDPKDF